MLLIACRKNCQKCFVNKSGKRYFYLFHDEKQSIILILSYSVFKLFKKHTQNCTLSLMYFRSIVIIMFT